MKAPKIIKEVNKLTQYLSKSRGLDKFEYGITDNVTLLVSTPKSKITIWHCQSPSEMEIVFNTIDAKLKKYNSPQGKGQYFYIIEKD